MKKFIAILAIFFILFIGTIAILCIYRYDAVTFGESLIMYSDPSAEGYDITIAYQGEEFSVTGYNKTSLYKTLLRGGSARKRELWNHTYNLESMVIRFGDEVELTVLQASASSDEVFLRYKELESGKTKYYSIKGYRTWHNFMTDLEIDE